LALFRHGVPWHCLRLRYNCPNIQAIADRFPKEVDKCRILHYLAPLGVKKSVDFASEESVARLLDRTDLEPINRLLQQHLRRVHDHAVRAAG
jgi:hypothetical protein